MRKATIIVIAIIFVASIVIVGQFGLNPPNVKSYVYIDDFIFTTINGVEVQDLGDGTGKKFVMLKYEKDLIVLIDFSPDPYNADGLDEVEVEVVSPDDYQETAILSHDAGWQLQFLKPGVITVSVNSPDTRQVKRQLMIIVQ